MACVARPHPLDDHAVSPLTVSSQSTLPLSLLPPARLPAAMSRLFRRTRRAVCQALWSTPQIVAHPPSLYSCSTSAPLSLSTSFHTSAAACQTTELPLTPSFTSAPAEQPAAPTAVAPSPLLSSTPLPSPPPPSSDSSATSLLTPTPVDLSKTLGKSKDTAKMTISATQADPLLKVVKPNSVRTTTHHTYTHTKHNCTLSHAHPHPSPPPLLCRRARSATPS